MEIKEVKRLVKEIRKTTDRALEVRGNDTFLVNISNELLSLEEELGIDEEQGASCEDIQKAERRMGA